MGTHSVIITDGVVARGNSHHTRVLTWFRYRYRTLGWAEKTYQNRCTDGPSSGKPNPFGEHYRIVSRFSPGYQWHDRPLRSSQQSVWVAKHLNHIPNRVGNDMS